MKTLLLPLLTTLAGLLRSRALLHLEILALRQQLAMVASREPKRFRSRRQERLFWVWLYRMWAGLSQDTHDLQAGYPGPLAPARVQALLVAIPITPRKAWAA